MPHPNNNTTPIDHPYPSEPQIRRYMGFLTMSEAARELNQPRGRFMYHVKFSGLPWPRHTIDNKPRRYYKLGEVHSFRKYFDELGDE